MYLTRLNSAQTGDVKVSLLSLSQLRVDNNKSTLYSLYSVSMKILSVILPYFSMLMLNQIYYQIYSRGSIT